MVLKNILKKILTAIQFSAGDQVDAMKQQFHIFLFVSVLSLKNLLWRLQRSIKLDSECF